MIPADAFVLVDSLVLIESFELAVLKKRPDRHECDECDERVERDEFESFSKPFPTGFVS